MEIQRLRIRDYEEMIGLWERAGLPYKPRGRDSREAIGRQMRLHPDFFLGAFEGERLIGAVIVSSEERKGWINRLAVEPDYRGRGIASALIAESEKVLRKHGIRILGCLIEETNVVSKELFKKCGYSELRNIIYFSKRDDDES